MLISVPPRRRLDGSAGKPAFGPLTVALADESGLTALLLRLATGQITSGLRIEGVTNDGDTVYRLDLADVAVTGVEETDSAGYRASFDYGRVKLTTFAQEPDGSLGSPEIFTWNRIDNTSNVDPLPVLGAGGGVGGLGQGDTFFLEVTGLSGGSTADDFQGAFDVVSFAFSIANPATVGSGGGGAGAGKVTFSPLTLTFANETGLTDFLALVSSGEVLSRVSLIGARSGGDGLDEVYRANLGFVVVSNVEEDGADGYRVTLDYATIGVVQQTQNPDGSVGPPQTFGNVSDAVPAGSGDPLGNGSQYFMLIDGVFGDSNQDQHVGWFDLPGFHLDVESLLGSGGGGSGAGVVDFDPLVADLLSLNGLTGVLTKLANGQIIKGVRIEGVTNDGETVYRLDIADVVVRQVLDDDGAGFRSSFEFGRVRLQLFPQEPDGSLGPPETFSWNLVTGTSDIGTLPVIAANHPPAAGDDSGVVDEDASRVFTWEELFGNDSDVDVGDPLTITSVQAGLGSVVLDSVARTVTYFANHDDFDLLVTGGAPAADSFTYTLTDKAGATATGKVTM
ncbi:MAG TPA: type VI secretion system tube protein Hcp, partial [Acidimicrobiia bacterium]|nr:type VI secretion system tube protein Hcp [Acidimicrobiia bacterium]